MKIYSGNKTIDQGYFQENLSLREEGTTLIKKVIDLASELEIAKYKIETSLESIRTRMKIEENLINNDDSKMSTFDIFMKELNTIAEPSFRDNYYSFMEKEVIELNKIIEIKHNQLQESFKLNKVLIGKLFSADNGLKFLEERALSACKINIDNVLTKIPERKGPIRCHSEQS